jgi:nitroreductase
MNALDALHSRISVAFLTDPAPDEAALVNIYKSALRAADHGKLRPWRFLVVKGPARERLGDLFLEAALADDASLVAEKQDKISRKPLRAPMLLVTVSSIKQHPKVPTIEQEFSAAAATQNMLVAAHAQGLGAMWRTGSMAYHPMVMKGLGLTEHEKIIGFLYLGSIGGPTKTLVEPELEQYFSEW